MPHTDPCVWPLIPMVLVTLLRCTTDNNSQNLSYIHIHPFMDTVPHPPHTDALCSAAGLKKTVPMSTMGLILSKHGPEVRS